MNFNNIKKWHKSLKYDCYRNKIIIPHFINELKNKKYSTVLDIGSGSGYIHEYVFKQVKSKIKRYDAIDKNINMLKFSMNKNKVNKNKKLNFILNDFISFKSIKKYDFIILSFTLLEFKLFNNFCKKLAKHLKKNGKVIVYVPDILQDILNNQVNNTNYLKEYIHNNLDFQKKINNSDISFPFLINRLEKLLEYFTSNGFVLFNIYEKECSLKKSFIAEFKHKQ